MLGLLLFSMSTVTERPTHMMRNAATCHAVDVAMSASVPTAVAILVGGFSVVAWQLEVMMQVASCIVQVGGLSDAVVWVSDT